MDWLRKIYYRLSPQNRLRVRRILYWPQELLTKPSDPKIPHKGLVFTGAGDFEKTGQRQLAYLKNYTGLQSGMKVLDVGSGMGRTAFALTKFLNSEGSYYGFDAMPQGIKWCKEHYQDLDNFSFEYIEAYNNLYNESAVQSTQITFPYESDSFDRVFLFSVFSHMLPEEVEHYLAEIYRVLRPGGQVLATFFSYDAEVLERMEQGSTDMRFKVPKQGYWLMDESVSHANVAYDEQLLEQIIHRASSDFIIRQKIKGYWSDFSNKSDDIDYQDIWVLAKPE